MNFTPNPQDNKKIVELSKIQEHLPEWLQNTDFIKSSFDNLVNHNFHQPNQDKKSGYVGIKENNKDLFISEINKERQDRQLRVGVLSNDIDGNLQGLSFSDQVVNYIRQNGGIINNESRLFSTKYYSFAPPIDLDKFVNFSNYLWIEDLVPIEIDSYTDIKSIIGQPNATIGGLTLESGMCIILRDDKLPKYNNKKYIIEGVGKEIVLIEDEESLFNLSEPQYTTIARESKDKNYWSRTNRWFHRDVIDNLNIVDFSKYHAKRPIIEFIPNIQLYNFGNYARPDVDVVSDKNIISIIQTREADSITLFDGMRILIRGETGNLQANNCVYMITGITQTGTPFPVLIKDGLMENGRPEVGEVIFAKSGTQNRLKFFYYNGESWIEGQGNSRLPKFELYDDMGVSLSDPVMYLNNDSYGSTIFRYKENLDNPVDIHIKQTLDVDKTGSFIFENTLYKDVVNYDDVIRKSYNGMKFYKLTYPEVKYQNEWLLSPEESFQYIKFDYTIKGNRLNGIMEYNREYILDVNVDTTLQSKPYIIVTINGKTLQKDIDYSLVDNTVNISLTYPLKDNDLLIIKVYSSDAFINTVGVFEEPVNVLANVKNENIEQITYNQSYEQFASIISNQPNFFGKSFGVNNYRNTTKNLSLGNKILQFIQPGALSTLLIDNYVTDIVQSIKYNSTEYIRFKNKFKNTISNMVEQGDYNPGDNIHLVINKALEKINLGKDEKSPFYQSMVGGDKYFIPPTPSYLGLMRCYEPKVFNYDTLGSQQLRLLGHDGSINHLYGDYRDDAILAFEQLIYESINPIYKEDVLNINILQYIPNKFRKLKYSFEEWLYVYTNAVDSWAFKNKLNISENVIFDPGNSWTWNYRGSYDYENKLIPVGSWRGLYKWLFDTDAPHTNPWYMLGFSNKPEWWDYEYGNAPYTKENVKMWNDIGNGIIKQGINKGEYSYLKRPNLKDIIPIDEQGNLLPPDQAGIVPFPTMAKIDQDWKVGDYGPAEVNWFNSSSYAFDICLSIFLMYPIKWFECAWITNKTKTIFPNTSFEQIVDSDTNKRYMTENKTVYGEEENTNTGLQQWVGDYLKSQNIDIGNYFGSLVRGINTNLVYKIGGYIKNDSIKLISDSIGMVPEQNYQVTFTQSQSIDEPTYSAVKINWDGSDYVIEGYDLLHQHFTSFIPNETGGTTSKTIGDVTVTHYTNYLDEKIDNDYQTRFGTIQDVYNFLRGYGKYLQSLGWVFEYYNVNLSSTINWDYLAEKFVEWTNTELEIGDVFIASPGADEIEFNNNHGFIGSITQKNGGFWSLLNQNASPLLPSDVDIVRYENKLIIRTRSENERLCLLRLSKYEFEHVLIIDNITDFGNIIYDSLYNIRIKKMKFQGIVSGQWNGTLLAPGFIVQQNTIIDNFEKVSSDFKRFYDNDAVPSNIEFFDRSRHLMGFQRKIHYDDLISDSRNQYDLYLQMIRNKGTIGVFEKIAKATSDTPDFTMFENWAFLMGQYGNNHNKRTIEFNIKQSEIKSNPQYIRYSFGDTVGNGAIAEVNTMIANGITIINGGQNYHKNDILEINDGVGTTTKIKVNNTLMGVILDVEIIDNGIYTDLPINPVSATGGQYTINNIDISNVGINYNMGDILTLADGVGQRGELIVNDVNSNGEILSYTLINNGLYTEFPTNPVMVTGGQYIIDDIEINTSGINYNIGDILTALIDNIVPLTIEVTEIGAFGVITDYEIIDSGLYQTLPSAPVSVTGGQYKINFTDIINSGENYNIDDILTLNGGSGIEGQIRVTNVDVDGKILTFDIENSGLYTQFPTNPVTVTGGQFISQFSSLVNMGSGYVVGDILTVNGGTGSPTIIEVDIVDVGGEILAATIINNGLYSDFPVNPVTVSGGTGSDATFNLVSLQGSGATFNLTPIQGSDATFNLSYGIDSINVIDGGRDYIDANIYITGNAVASANVIDGSVNSIDVINSGIEYITQPDIIVEANVPTDYVPPDLPEDDIISIGYADNRWLTKTDIIKSNFFKNNNYQEYHKMPTSGFVKLNQVDKIVWDNDELFNTIYNENDYVWLLKNEKNDWNVYKYVRVSEISEVIAEATFTQIVTNDEHNLIEGDIIDLVGDFGTNPDIQGKYEVIEIIDINNFKIDFVITDNNEYDIDPPLLYKFDNRRFSDYSSKPVEYLEDGDLIFIDKNLWFNESIDDDNNITTHKPHIPLWSVLEYKLDDDKWIWSDMERDTIDISCIDDVILFNMKNEKTLMQLELFDPVKRIFPRKLLSNIEYVLDYDPAKYTHDEEGIIINDTGIIWGELQVGQLWWDISTVRYLDYEQGDDIYKSKHWGRKLKGSSIDVYEWIESRVSPNNWNLFVENNTDNTLDPLPSGEWVERFGWVEKQEFNTILNKSITKYYFWVKNTSFNSKSVKRRLTCNQITNILDNPSRSGYIWFAPVNSVYTFNNPFNYRYDGAFIIGNIDNLITDDNQAIQINYNNNPEYDGNVHTEWEIISENSTQSIPDELWQKMKDSLVGYDRLGNIVPDPELPDYHKLGNNIRPRQTWFKDRQEARRVFTTSCNQLLIQENIVDIYTDWVDAFKKYDDNYGVYDQEVETLSERNNIVIKYDGLIVKVNTDETLENKWTVYEYNGGVWTRIREQIYDVSKFWDYANWVNPEFDETIQPTYIFDTFNDRDVDLTIFSNNEVVKVKDNGSGRYILTRFIVTEYGSRWETVLVEDGTIQLNDKLYNYDIEDDYLEYEARLVTEILVDYFRSN